MTDPYGFPGVLAAPQHQHPPRSVRYGAARLPAMKLTAPAVPALWNGKPSNYNPNYVVPYQGADLGALTPDLYALQANLQAREAAVHERTAQTRAGKAQARLRRRARRTRAYRAYDAGMTRYTNAQIAKAERVQGWLSGPYSESEGVMERLRSPWAWLLPAALGVAAWKAKKKHQPTLAIAAAAALLVVNGARPPGQRFP